MATETTKTETTETTRRKIHTPLVLTAPAMPVKAQIKGTSALQILLADDRYLSVNEYGGGIGLWSGMPKEMKDTACEAIKAIPPVEVSLRPFSKSQEYRALVVVPNKGGKSVLILAGTVPILLVLVDPKCLVVEEAIPTPSAPGPEPDEDEDEEEE